MTFSRTNGAISRITQGGRAYRTRDVMSAIHLAKHRINRPHDRDDIRDFVARNDVRKDRQVGEGGAPPLHPIGLRTAVRDQVAADLAAWSLDARVALALRHPGLRDRLQRGT